MAARKILNKSQRGHPAREPADGQRSVPGPQLAGSLRRQIDIVPCQSFAADLGLRALPDDPGLMVRRSRGLRRVHGDCAAMFGFPPPRPSLGRRIQPQMPPVGAPAANPSSGRSGQEEDETGRSEVDRQPESADLGMLEARQAEARAEALAGKGDAFFARPGQKAASTLTWIGSLAILFGHR